MRYLFSRFFMLVGMLVAASVVVFLLIEWVPGDPATSLLGLDADAAALEQLRHQLGLVRPLPLRYLDWARGFLVGDWGLSYAYQVPVRDIAVARLAVSFPLAVYAQSLVGALAFPLASYAAGHHGRPGDILVMAACHLSLALPGFWLGILLVQAFAVNIGWFSAGGFPGWGQGFFPAIKALTLPALALAVPHTAILTRTIRTSLLEVLHSDFMRTARAKGLSYRQAMRRHAMRNALLPVLTMVGMQFSFLLAGTIVVENVFVLPGLGRLISQSLNQRDAIVVQNVVMLLVCLVIVVQFLVDLAQVLIDPRLRRRV